MPISPSSVRIALVASVLAVAILAATALSISLQRAAEIAGYQSAVISLDDVMAEQATRWIQPVDKLLAAMQSQASAPSTAGSDARVHRAASPSPPKLGFDLLSRRRATLARVSDLMVIDAAGRLTLDSRAWPTPRADFSDTEAYLHFRDSDDRGLYITAPLASPLDGERVILLARRLNDDDGKFAGIAAASIKIGELQALFEEVLPAGRSVTLFRSDGVVLASLPRDESALGRRVSEQAPLFRVIASGGGLYQGPGEFDPSPIIASLHPLRDLPLVIEGSVQESTALAHWTMQRPWFVMGGLVAIVFVILLLRMIESHSHLLEHSESALAERNRELETTRLHLDIALANMSQGVSFFDGNQKLIVCNRRYAEIYGLPEIAMRPGTSLAEIVAFATDAGCALVNSADAHTRFDRDGTGFGEPVHIVTDLMDGRVISIRRQPMPDGGWVGTHEDITAQRAAEKQTAFLAQHDVLTGLANRALFHQRMDMALATTARGGACAVLFLDLDRFKAVNDTLGHQVGDELLRTVAARLKGCVRASDTVARLGGDEFAILQDDIGAPEDVAHLASRVIDVVSEPYAIGGHDVSVGTSVGIALAPANATSIDSLVRNADLALYRSKSDGRGTFRFFEPEMDAIAQDRLKLEHELRDAIARHEFQLYYQPIVDLRSGALRAFEALIRWNHPTRGLLGPGDFLTTTEDSGLIVLIGEWALRQACAEARDWPDDVRVALNVSDVQFRRTDVSDVVSRALADTRLPGSRLEIDMNETALSQRPEQTLATLHKLHAQGVAIVLDDFGVGPSSLSGLRRFPFDKVKVDASCIRDIAENPDMLFTVRAIMRLCADLGIHTVVEGVETPEQRDLLLREHCDQAQGYLFGRPRPADAIAGQIAGGGVTFLAAATATREFTRRASRVAA